MSTTITVNDGSGATTTPDVALRYQQQRRSRSVITDLIGGDVVVALLTPRQRSGVLRLHYRSEADAAAALELHSRASTFTLASDDADTLDMTYVLDGDVTSSQQYDELDEWSVDVGYQEITP